APLGLIVGITEDVDHNIWLVSGGRRRALLRIRDRALQEELTEPQIPSPHRVAADPTGGIWLGLMRGGLARYRNGRIETFRPKGMEESFVTELSVASDGTVLAATTSGLIGWKAGKVQTMTARNGLPCDSVSTLITDHSGVLWLYTQ